MERVEEWQTLPVFKKQVGLVGARSCLAREIASQPFSRISKSDYSKDR
jgi:hypothetical protein